MGSDTIVYRPSRSGANLFYIGFPLIMLLGIYYSINIEHVGTSRVLAALSSFTGFVIVWFMVTDPQVWKSMPQIKVSKNTISLMYSKGNVPIKSSDIDQISKKKSGFFSYITLKFKHPIKVARMMQKASSIQIPFPAYVLAYITWGNKSRKYTSKGYYYLLFSLAENRKYHFSLYGIYYPDLGKIFEGLKSVVNK